MNRGPIASSNALYEKILAIVTRSMPNKEIRLALEVRGTHITPETLHYQLNNMIKAKLLQRTPGEGKFHVGPFTRTEKPAPTLVPSRYISDFVPLKSIPRCTPMRSGALVFERLPQSFVAEDLK